MKTENLSTLKIHKMTQVQYDRELAAGNIDPNALYLTPDEETDLSGYATVEQLNDKSDKDHTHSLATTTANGFMSKDDKAKLDATNVAYATCSTAADVATKTATIIGNDNWALTVGCIVMVKFDITNTASAVTLNINNTGAYPIWYSNAEYTSSGSAYCGYAGRTITYSFNGTHWVWISGSYDANTQSNTNSTDTNSKIFLVGATTQGSNKTTYSHNEVYVGTDHHVYSNSKQVVNLSDTQALTNKTYNGYTLGAACAKGVDISVTSESSNLITSGGVYNRFAGCWVDFTDENGNPTTVPYLHWIEE